MLMGEVVYPGTYGLQEGETLSSVIRRAGGFRTTAYPDGAVLIRKQVKELEQRSRAELIRKIETTSPGDRLAAGRGAGEDSGTLQVLMQQQNQVLLRLRSQPAVGRLVIKISADIPSWAGTPADIELRSGDVLTVPKRPGFILISGQVYNSSAITYVPGKDAGWYLRRAGGATDLANRKEVFVIRANGLVVGRRSGEWYQDQVLSPSGRTCLRQHRSFRRLHSPQYWPCAEANSWGSMPEQCSFLLSCRWLFLQPLKTQRY
jgi:protein involved in polysaccharide export with SLBB domain